MSRAPVVLSVLRSHALWRCAVIAMVVAGTGGGVTASALSARSSGTSLHIFAPFSTGTLSQGLRIAKTIRGSCWTGSEGTYRSDAWRCMSGNYIYDPCFSSATGGSGGYLICARSPFTADVVKFVLTKPLPYKYGNKDADPTKFIPWAVQLTSGATCVNIQGATGAIAGMRIGYACSNDGILVGSPKRSSATWHIFYAKSFKEPSLSLVSIRQAWW